ncbi:hypothetical protein BDQ17DRAFT_1375934 [Cyathus striatus]|nr:hypothetical protein BDQ17DRAFT_1375934 [Cyathus striatus]
MDLNDADLTSFIQNNIEISAVFVAAITSLVYDIIYNFTEEERYIWSGMKWSLPKLLYIIARYSGLLYLLSASFFSYICKILSTNSIALLCEFS